MWWGSRSWLTKTGSDRQPGRASHVRAKACRGEFQALYVAGPLPTDAASSAASRAMRCASRAAAASRTATRRRTLLTMPWYRTFASAPA